MAYGFTRIMEKIYAAPAQILENSDVLGRERNLGKASF